VGQSALPHGEQVPSSHGARLGAAALELSSSSDAVLLESLLLAPSCSLLEVALAAAGVEEPPQAPSAEPRSERSTSAKSERSTVSGRYRFPRRRRKEIMGHAAPRFESAGKTSA
jgi:hypothetical protein